MCEKKCHSCGGRLADGDLFCTSCGAKVKSSDECAFERSAVSGIGNLGDLTIGDAAEALKTAGTASGKIVANLIGGGGVAKLVGLALLATAGFWIYGAINAHQDVSDHKALGIILRRMYGTEFNPLTRHGYRMYIKHFTTTDPTAEFTTEELGSRLKDAFQETFEDLDAYCHDKNNTPERRSLYRFRENLADAAGNASVMAGSGIVDSDDELSQAEDDMRLGLKISTAVMKDDYTEARQLARKISDKDLREFQLANIDQAESLKQSADDLKKSAKEFEDSMKAAALLQLLFGGR